MPIGADVESGGRAVDRAGQLDPEPVRPLHGHLERAVHRDLLDLGPFDVDMRRRRQLTAVRIDREVCGLGALVAEGQHQLAISNQAGNRRLVRDRTGRTAAGLLLRHRLVGRRRRLPARDRRRHRAGLVDRRLPIGAVEVERRGEVATRGPSPAADVRLPYAGPQLEEADHRGVVEHLRVHVPADRPRRHHRHRYSRAEPDRLTGVPVVALTRGRPRRDRRRDVVEVPVVLVEVDQQHGLRPGLRVGRDRVEQVVDEVRAADRRGRSGVLGVDRGRHQPADLRQRARP